MSEPIAIIPVRTIDGNIRSVVARAGAEGFAFMDRLVERWEDGTNRFDRNGETYWSVWREGRLVGLGGLNRDPYCGAPDVGRVRHVYILPEARRGGAGTALMGQIIGSARQHFVRLRLRTTTDRGSAFYDALGFARSVAPDASHEMWL